MFIQVRLLNGFSKPLTYQWPEGDKAAFLGALVRVPLRNHIVPAIITHILDQRPPGDTFTIKPIVSVEPVPPDPDYYQFITKLARWYQTDPIKLVQSLRYFVRTRALPEPLLTLSHAFNKEYRSVTLTPEQETVTEFLKKALHESSFCPTVLHGVTGSGKTEVYKKLILEALHLGKSVLLLLPEITLALRMAQLLKEQLPASVGIYSFHSASATREKLVLWQRLVHALPTLIIGVHMPIVLPIARLGLIIVDEEHEAGYQEKNHPKINSKDAALMRAHLLRIPIVLGSATPSLTSLYNVKKGTFHFFQLKHRFAGAFPTVSTVFLSDTTQRRRNFWISKQLDEALRHCLEKKEQAIVFINRRGFSFFVQCSSCTFIFTCANCSVSLTLHDGATLACHYCGFRLAQPQACPACRSPEENFLKKGIGTQQVVSILQKLFPHARIGRADMDATLKKKQWKETIQAFCEGSLDILVGTQTIAKGFHFPNVTLVGILWADLNVHFPLYNASETCLQQLIQVAGRAGRQRSVSQVIVQAMTDHRIFAYLNEIDYLQFYAPELTTRSELLYPPFYRLAEIEIKNRDALLVEQDAHAIANHLNTYAQEYGITLLGPAQPPVHMVQKVHVRKIYLKCQASEPLIRAFEKLDLDHYTSAVFFTPNPTS